ncbi:MAG: SRPBCC family protein [Akkermansiaceae bacterium]|nr:SRPBCC family protein [Akkermansiaceae bacterium]
MKIHVLEDEQVLPVPPEEAWAFFSDVRNLDEITPDDMGFKTEYSSGDGPVHPGQIIVHRVKVAPLVWLRWVTEIKVVDPGRAFVDEQRAGPYRFWHHRHSFEATEGGTLMKDLVHYAMPLGPLGAIPHALFVRKKLESIFRFRREMLERRFGGHEAAGEPGS